MKTKLWRSIVVYVLVCYSRKTNIGRSSLLWKAPAKLFWLEKHIIPNNSAHRFIGFCHFRNWLLLRGMDF